MNGWMNGLFVRSRCGAANRGKSTIIAVRWRAQWINNCVSREENRREADEKKIFISNLNAEYITAFKNIFSMLSVLWIVYTFWSWGVKYGAFSMQTPSTISQIQEFLDGHLSCLDANDVLTSTQSRATRAAAAGRWCSLAESIFILNLSLHRTLSSNDKFNQFPHNICQLWLLSAAARQSNFRYAVCCWFVVVCSGFVACVRWLSDGCPAA